MIANSLRDEGIFLQKFAHQLQRGVLVSLGLDQHLEDFGVDGPLKVDHSAVDFQIDLVQMPYVNGPLLARRFGYDFDQIGVHMSGFLLRSHMNASQDVFRDSSPKQVDGLDRPVASSACLASWIDRSHHLLITLQVLASARYGGSSLLPCLADL
jgi:hypothetical protein